MIDRNIRYYMGRHKIRIIKQAGKKALIEHLEDGYVGNKREGYKQVLKHDHDSCLIRHCNYIQKFRGVRKNDLDKPWYIRKEYEQEELK